MSEIPYYGDYISPAFLEYLISKAKPVFNIPDLLEVGSGGGLESKEALEFLCALYDLLKQELNAILCKRNSDRQFIDQQTKACFEFNQTLKRDFNSPDYKTLIGAEDADSRIVIGPKDEFYCKKGKGRPIAPLPDFLQGQHVTLFGPPDDAKLSVNAMNAYHRKLKDEPAIIEELLKAQSSKPKWGADDEDSKTPLRADLIAAGINLSQCFEGNITYTDSENNRTYQLESDNLAQAFKRFPGLALPCLFLLYRSNPIPLHLYDFALHFFKNWHNPRALTFYAPKLENEEEARYLKKMFEQAENLIQKTHPQYVTGTIRVMIVLENPRAVFRVNEIMDELYPYFAGASLGWHDYLASTARLFKEDGNYRIPVKADPNIVIKYIKTSHHLLADVVGTRGGVKVGGMYGILPTNNDRKGPSFQISIKGFIKDVITQLKRDLSGFWVAHPDFVRIGLALVEAWRQYSEGDKIRLERLIRELLNSEHQQEVLDFISGPDIQGLSIDDPLYPRSLIVADSNQSNFIANNHPDEIRYNVFQSLQYLADWLAGNGCVALPAEIAGIPVRVMDDLATLERSRWEVWHEIYYERFALTEFLTIVHEEMHFIRKDLSNPRKIVQVKWESRTEKWYPVAMQLLIRLMTDRKPVEFATELLLAFTIETIRAEVNPWQAARNIDPFKFKNDPYIDRFNYYFEMCGSRDFATAMAKNLITDFADAEKCILAFNKKDLIEAAEFHGNIGENKKNLDTMASSEQKLVLDEDQAVRDELITLGKQYLNKFGIKFLISAKDKSASEILTVLKSCFNKSTNQELQRAKEELWQITKKRMQATPINSLNVNNIINNILKAHAITGAAISISTGQNQIQNICLGESIKGQAPVTDKTWFEMASLSKAVASCFAIDYFAAKNIPLSTPANLLFAQTSSTFRIKANDPIHSDWGDQVTLEHLMSHSALNLHYVNGVPANLKMPTIRDLLDGNLAYSYVPIEVINPPGERFQYSGGGFLVLEHLLECLEQKSIVEITQPFLDQLGMYQFTFAQETLTNKEYAYGYNARNEMIIGTRKMFPAFAAGAMGTAGDLNLFLHHLTTAYQSPDGSGPISHDTARIMLYGTDRGAMKFIGATMGLGIFTAEAGPNKLAIHQGANDGFRCLFLHCYDGPNIGMGFTVLCNAEFNGVLFISEIAHLILTELKMQGIDTTKFTSNFDTRNVQPEQIVNVGYKNLIFSAFEPLLPETIITKGPRDPLAKYNLAVGSKILQVSNQKFARAENLISEFLPVFDPGLYGCQGKIMDSWETVRHNQKECDTLMFELPKQSSIGFISVSTKFHCGNQAQFIKIDAFDLKSDQWIEILPKTPLLGHARKNMLSAKPNTVYSKIQVSIYPDGGITRLGLYSDNLPEPEKNKFRPVELTESIVYTDIIPKTQKPLTIAYSPDDAEIKRNWLTLKKGDEFDVASAAYGAKILAVSNEHYGPAVQIISPYGPMHMFDGFESARSRTIGHHEEILIQLARASKINRIEMNFKYFINNNPRQVSVLGLTNNTWLTLVEPSTVKAFAGSKKQFIIKNETNIGHKNEFEQIKIIILPDGGINRIRVITNF
jgi:allantoicase/malate synthase/CubicO group peptidase (beta-lactamase class C family)/2-oxo-4-hydroxy-4-carboxy--5-ureidoimidazoline (OHCU) decarboxylase